MRKGPYYSEDILVEKMQRGEYNWLDYINHFSEEWQDEYEEYCREYSLSIGNESAEQFVNYKRWKKETLNLYRQWLSERILIQGKWICSPKCATS